MIDHDAQGWAGLIKDYPEAAWAGGICGSVLFGAINFAWWLIELPGLINGHRDSLLLGAFAGSLGLISFDAVSIAWACRCAHRIRVAMHSGGNDDEKT